MPTFFSAPKQTPRVPTPSRRTIVATVPAHRVVLCARAGTPRRARPRARVPRVTTPKSARRRRTPRDAMPVVGVPVRGDGGALAARSARRTRARRRGWTRGARAKRRKKTFAFGATYDDIDTENVSATTAVHLAASLEYLMLDREAEACASRVAHAARARDWRERLGGVSGALAALAAAAARADGPSSRRCWARSRRSTPRRPRPSPRRSRRSTPTYGRRCGARTSSKREPGDDETRAPGCVYL